MWKAPKQLIVLCLGAWGLVYGQTESRTSLIESARTEKEANLTPEKPPKLETRIEAIEHSLPYRLLTSETGGLGVGFGNIVPGAGLAATAIHPNGTLARPYQLECAGTGFHE